jgi:hypothetical protein
MDWIWSWMCLELLCTSTQSSNLKWVSGGGINSPRHQTSRWLKAAEKGTVEWSDAMHRRYVGSSGAEDLASKSPLLASNWPSDRSTLHLDQGVGSSGVEGFVLARLCMNSNRVSDRPTGFPLRPLDHPVLLSSLLFLYNSSDATRKWTVGSSAGT